MERVYALDVRLLEDEAVFRSLYAGMPRERRERIGAARTPEGARLSLGAGFLLRRALADAGIPEAETAYGENGKPFLPGGGLCFNLSHSGSVAACAVSRAPVGLDVEAVRHFSDGLAAFVFHRSEIEAVRALPGDPDEAFTALWTVKESVMKQDGAGLRLPPKRIRALSFDPVRVEVDGSPREELRFTEYRFPGYRMTVCSRAEPFPDSPEWVSPPCGDSGKE